MDVQIIDTSSSEYTDTVTIRVDNTEAFVSRSKRDGEINVLCMNASNRVWRGSGRFFGTWEAALEGYKSAKMKTAISAARDLIEAEEDETEDGPAETHAVVRYVGESTSWKTARVESSVEQGEDEIGVEFQEQVIRAMAKTVGSGALTWYNDREINAVLHRAAELGWVFRPSTSQVQWTDEGIAALDEETSQRVYAEIRQDEERQAAEKTRRREESQRRRRLEAEAEARAAHDEKVERRKSLIAAERRASIALESQGPALYVHRTKPGEWWATVEGSSHPVPFRTSREACAAVEALVKSWRFTIEHSPIPPYVPACTPNGDPVEYRTGCLPCAHCGALTSTDDEMCVECGARADESLVECESCLGSGAAEDRTPCVFCGALGRVETPHASWRGIVVVIDESGAHSVA